ncbi:hypothetical protein [Halorubrum sp. SD626R]|jgi:hypothetical protein|uniref:hypothetical protein n=1 Tax=Halorubrum sp. SD626R TaxID=1419722 RepID=UPI000AEC42F4|nr:hypothetical protein [Halorubrum sp. SD626R]TKX80541.1 hypothetical protein EXE53_10310 [Halorubrum sp. SD626R]
MASEPGDDAARAADGGDDTAPARETGSPLVDRWVALDRGWQALALGLGIVALHAAGQAAGLL